MAFYDACKTGKGWDVGLPPEHGYGSTSRRGPAPRGFVRFFAFWTVVGLNVGPSFEPVPPANTRSQDEPVVTLRLSFA